MTQHVASPAATNASHYATLPDALLPAGIWPAHDKEALNSERSEAALLPLSWILVTPCPAQTSCLLSLETQPGPSKTGNTVQNGLQYLLCLSMEGCTPMLGTKPGNDPGGVYFYFDKP